MIFLFSAMHLGIALAGNMDKPIDQLEKYDALIYVHEVPDFFWRLPYRRR